VPIRDRLGFLGTVLLLIAMALTAAAAINIFVWACRGYIDVGLFAAAVSLAVTVLVLLPVWTLLFRDGSVINRLSLWFAILSAGTPLLGAVLAIIGEFNCAGGALIVSGWFGTVVAVLVICRTITTRRA
jgi:hypothetical protein